MHPTRFLPVQLLFTGLMLLALQGCATSALDRGNAAFERGDFDAAEAAWLPLAEQGNAGAQFNLALLNEKPRPGRNADLERARAWYRAAAEQGYLPAMNRLANLHRFEGDDESALALYTLAARLGSDGAVEALRAWGRPVPSPDLEAELVKRQVADLRSRQITTASPHRGDNSWWSPRRQQDFYWQKLQEQRSGDSSD